MSGHVVGIGVRPGVVADPVVALVRVVLDRIGLDPADAVFATIATRAEEPGLREAVRRMDPASGGRVVGCSRDDLAGESVPHPSDRVAMATGTPSVAEAAALHTARSLPGAVGAELVVPKTVGDGVTAAVAVAR